MHFDNFRGMLRAFLQHAGLAFADALPEETIRQAFADEGVEPGELRLGYPYWEHPAPITAQVRGSYADREAPTEGLIEHGWDHSLGEIITAIADAGLRVDFLHEFDSVPWSVPWLVKSEDGRYRLPADAAGGLPLYFSLKATRPAES
jgi:hypothetical protein